MADISAKLVKELRDKTGAGMMDCKKALQENEGDIEKSIEWLRKKGIASAEKKAGRVAAEGLVDSYIHTGGRIGVMVEVNCQTDFVARNEDFKALVKDIAKQVAACPQVEYVKVADIPAAVVEKEKSIEMGKDDLGNKPENIREKIVQGRIEKRLKELCLLDQGYIRDPNKTVEEYVKEHIAKLGENIQVRRFTRFVLGEGIEVEQSDFAAEVAAQMGTNVEEAPATEAPIEETPVEETPTAEAPVDEAPAAEAPAEEPKPAKDAPASKAFKPESKGKDKDKSSKKKKK